MHLSNIELLGNDLNFLKALEFAKNVAVTKIPVLIVGEAGTGKRTLARYIHNNSGRNAQPIKIVDCNREPDIVSGDLFGHRDDETQRFIKGAFETANGGSIVLANIDTLDDSLQKKLFKILQELADYEIDVRLIATTTKNLSKYVGAGRFHRALYTLFSGTQISLVPLRERGDDLQLIAESILAKSGATLATDALEKFKTFYWTNNITELNSVLKNALENSNGGIVDLNALESCERKAEISINDDENEGFRLMSLRDAEKLLIKKALVHTCENRTQAAKILGVSIRTLRNKINEYRTEGSSYFVSLR